MSISGKLLIGNTEVDGSAGQLLASNPATGETLLPAFALAGKAEVALACELANAAFDEYRETLPEQRAVFLETIASNIERIGDVLIERAMQETGLPKARLQGERARTCSQLRLFASVVRSGDALGVRIDSALPDRQPLPRPDLRQRRVALGPVAVFGASNFPLAFSVAGGDTASALAAGCPVVVKGHSAHPGTAELVGRAVQAAVADCGLPAGVFSLLFGSGSVMGGELIAHPFIQAAGFTGSRSGGVALMKIAQARPQPIPFYGELSAVNPVFLLPGALAERGSDLGRQFVASLTLGAGQFCTNPGLVLGIRGAGFDAFAAAAADVLGGTAAQTMLTPGIHAAYEKGVTKLNEHASVNCLARGQEGATLHAGRPGLFAATAEAFLANPALHDELFGASALLVSCADAEELLRVARMLEGQLTATLHLNDADSELAKALLPILERKAGRILANGWPTGVEVCHAMVHGGPWPATTDARTTSVGSAAIERFLRPVCYQDLPSYLLPAPLQTANPLGLRRLVDGEREQPLK